MLPCLRLAILCLLSARVFAHSPAPVPALPAFPGAEGFGADTRGGRGGRVVFVTHLGDAGPGSLRAACETQGPRTVLFRVSGTIRLSRPLVIEEPFLTLAGQSAPGDGICVRDSTVTIATHDVIVRHLRFRLGDETAHQSDSLNLASGARRVVVDHCSATWSIDESLSLSGVISDVTVQWCLIGESLHRSKHAKGAHGLGSLSRATGPVSWHHNLWLHTHSRNPRLGDNYGRPPYPRFDVRNNVVYNYIHAAAGLTQGNLEANYLGNVILPGADTVAPKPIVIGPNSNLRLHVRDNLVDGDAALTADNARMLSATEIDGRRQVTLVDAPFPAAPVTTWPAAETLPRVLASAGATRPRRDAVDTRLVASVRNRTGRVIDSQAEVGGWPELVSATPPPDADEDGLPDAWEQRHAFNPADPVDGASDADGDGYTNLEEFLNETDPRS